MTFSAGSARLTLAAMLVALSLALAGCSQDVSTSTQGEATPTARCAADYCAPANWDTARASTPLPQIAAFVEPLNVVISARSNVSLAAIQTALKNWLTVATSTSVSVSGIHVKCISSEKANVTGQGFLAQEAAWRLGGCVHGNSLSLTGNEDHVRLWHQPVSGSKYGAWFATASYETLCLVKNGKLITAKSDTKLAAKHPGGDYHCVDGGPGSFQARHPDGYEDGAKTFVADVTAAARAKGWKLTKRTVTVKRAEHAGEGGVAFNDDVYVLTITTA